MVRQCIALCIICFFSITSEAQVKKFDKKFGYFEYELVPMHQIVDSQQNHIVVGIFRGYHDIEGNIIQSRGDGDIYMIKYDALNNIVWVKTLGSSSGENPASVSCDKYGNIYITGSFNGNAFYTSSIDSVQAVTPYSQSRFIAKLDPSGATKWLKRFSGTTSAPDAKAQVINDHEGRVYLIHTNRANGTLNTFKFQDSVITNPTMNYINVPRWLMIRLDEQTGNIKWLDYIANPNIGSGFITYLNISSPQIDSKNNINFAVTYDGKNVEPIYIFGRYVALNPRINNVLVKIDSMGVVNRIRDLGEGNTTVSEATDLGITSRDEFVLINKKANGSENGILYNYLTNTAGINYARIYDSTFSLLKVVQLGSQNIGSFMFDKRDRLITLGVSKVANYNLTPVDEVIKIDSTRTTTINTQSQVYPYYVRYNNQFTLDTFYLENSVKPLMILTVTQKSLKLSESGNILPLVSYPSMNKVLFRYDSLFRKINSNAGKQRDREDPIAGMVEDENDNVYTIGTIHGKTIFSNANGLDSLSIPYENVQDVFISKYDKLGNLIWLKTIGSKSSDNCRFLIKTSTGLLFAISNPEGNNSNYENTNTIVGKFNVVKVDFNGNFVWSKSVTTQVAGAQPFPNMLKVLKNGKILLGVNVIGDFEFDNQIINKVGDSYSQAIIIFDENTGTVVRHNRFALRNEDLCYLGSILQNSYEDSHGNLYFGITSVLNNLNSTATTNELYSLKQNTVTFSYQWANQSALLKLDSTLEIVSYKQFLAYTYLSDIAGQGDKIYLLAKGRNRQFIFGDTTIALHSYAAQKHFINYMAVLDTNFRFTKVMKYDTSVNENQFYIYSRKLLIDNNTKDVYQTLQFIGTTGIDSSSAVISSLGSTDMLFIKYDSVGNLLGGQTLGTAQGDYFITAIINKLGNVVFVSQAIDPNYTSTIVKKIGTDATGVNSTPTLIQIPSINQKVRKSFSTNTDVVIDKNILTPDNYVSQNIVLKEIGHNPDTTITVNQINFCKGDSAIISVKDVTNVKWKKNNQLLSLETSSVIKPKTSGKYKAILTTVENRIDSTREVEIFVEEIPTPLIKDTTVCSSTTNLILSATASTGNTLKWYGILATGGSPTTTAPTPATTTSGTYEYYVSQASTSTGCESDRSKITMVVNALPASPAVSDINYCVGATSNALSATASTGSALKWYGTLATGGTPTTTAPTPATTTSGTYEYYVSQASTSTGCESDRSKITMVVYALPSVPVVSDFNYCVGSAAGVLSATVSNGSALKWYGNLAIGGTATTTAPTPVTTTLGTYEYYVSQASTSTGCESLRAKLNVTINPIPSAPFIIRDVDNFMVSSATSGNTWYKDGATLTDTAYKFKPSIAGSYSVATTQKGCNSVKSVLYYYLITDVINLSDFEFIKLAPNPFVNQVNFDFLVKGYQKLNMEVFELTTGNKVASKLNLSAGTPIYLGNLVSGTYLIRISSLDNKINHQFKMIKL